jgi:hypothetical protein
MTSMRRDLDAELSRAGIQNALVLVRESWGTELLVRLWALGVSRPAAEHYYRAIDPCVLELTIGKLEVTGADSTTVLARLEPLARDSSRLVRSTESVDPTLLRLPGMEYPPVCQARLDDDAAGFTVLPPALLSRRTDVQFVRDLHARDSLLVRDHQGPIYLMKPQNTDVGSVPQFYEVRPDSLWDAWRRSP